MELVIAHTIGYMLKALKLGIDTSNFRQPFASIRHGNYAEFCEQVDAEISTLVEYSNGKIEVTNSLKPNDIHFAGLLKSGPAMKKLLLELTNNYGKLDDPDIPNSIYLKAAEFEISIRMHASNLKLINNKVNFIDVIAILASAKKISQNEIKQLQLGRRFINMIKHPKNQFKSWNEGIYEFRKANAILNKYSLTII
jgi:hypothetical protein